MRSPAAFTDCFGVSMLEEAAVSRSGQCLLNAADCSTAIFAALQSSPERPNAPSCNAQLTVPPRPLKAHRQALQAQLWEACLASAIALCGCSPVGFCWHGAVHD